MQHLFSHNVRFIFKVAHYPEVEGTHGPALSKDKATGWATWPTFKAQFQAGKVVEVELP